MNATLTMRRAILAGLAVILCAPAPPPAAAQVPETEYEGVQALGLALRRLGHTKRVLMIGAHPDDESTQVISTLALGQGAEVAYLSLTRGEGGQNGIGPELQEGLGLLRTEELLAARRLDGARQYFTRAYDYGFSKTAEEAFRHWPRDSVLADVVAVIREFRPDLVVSIFSGTPRDGHGQHQAAGILAREGFRAAGDPERFPDQVARGLRPHGATHLYQALWTPTEDADHLLATGGLDPLLGRSHYQVAMASRSRHRSQDMGRVLTPGPQASSMTRVASRLARVPDGGLFAGVDTALAGIARRADPAVAPALDAYERAVAAAVASFDAFHPAASLAGLTGALAILDEAAAAAVDADLRFRLAAERAELEDAVWLAAGLRLDAIAEDETVVPGQSFEVTVTLWNGGPERVRVDRLEPALPAGWRAAASDPLPESVEPGQIVERRFVVEVPEAAGPTQPYFLESPRAGDLYVWPAGVDVGVPFTAPPVRAAAGVRVLGRDVERVRDATYQTLDKMQGEIRRPVRVVPAVSVRVEPALALLPLEGTGDRRIRLLATLRSEAPGGSSGFVRPEAPPGWIVAPAEVPVDFDAPGVERTVELLLTPPPDAAPGAYRVDVPFVARTGVRFSSGYRLIDYPHTAPRALYAPASADVRALDVRVPAGLRVGYVAGAGDDVQASLRQMGIDVEPLDARTLAAGDLSVYDVIVAGIRAYEVRPDLVAHNQRLLDYTAAGGTFIVQYSQYEYTRPGIAPYPISMSRPHDRVTDETAPVRLLRPDHPVLTHPNRIGDADFDGWVQERGLYFLSEWDHAFVPILETADPGEDPLRGALLVAPYGEGTYVYTGLSFFRQLPAGVPGAYRLFANLLALGVDP